MDKGEERLSSYLELIKQLEPFDGWVPPNPSFSSNLSFREISTFEN